MKTMTKLSLRLLRMQQGLKPSGNHSILLGDVYANDHHQFQRYVVSIDFRIRAPLKKVRH